MCRPLTYTECVLTKNLLTASCDRLIIKLDIFRTELCVLLGKFTSAYSIALALWNRGGVGKWGA